MGNTLIFANMDSTAVLKIHSCYEVEFVQATANINKKYMMVDLNDTFVDNAIGIYNRTMNAIKEGKEFLDGFYKRYPYAKNKYVDDPPEIFSRMIMEYDDYKDNFLDIEYVLYSDGVSEIEIEVGRKTGYSMYVEVSNQSIYMVNDKNRLNIPTKMNRSKMLVF